jgi:hypothetical protein|tara:strand:- start:190 stop:444 length:255 start_codon:yes stop_codon:yes gene_type:complete
MGVSQVSFSPFFMNLKEINMAKLKDISKAQVLYDALMIVTGGEKYLIRDICDTLTNKEMNNATGNKEIADICDRINFHLIQQGY